MKWHGEECIGMALNGVVRSGVVRNGKVNSMVWCGEKNGMAVCSVAWNNGVVKSIVVSHGMVTRVVWYGMAW